MSSRAKAKGVTRRQAVVSGAVVAGMVGLTAGGVLTARQAPTPISSITLTDATTQRLLAVSSLLCGGGTLDPARARQLLPLIIASPTLSRGFLELEGEPPIAGVANEQSAAAITTSQAILSFWYTGAIAGVTVPDRSAVYPDLLAWQAMYTLPYAQCKGFGEWANPPDDVPIGEQTA